MRGVYNTENNDAAFNKAQPSADYRVMLLSAYAQDDYRVTNRLNVQLGLRLDMQLHPDKVPVNPAVARNPEFAQYQNKFGGVPQFNPRLSFNYQLNDANTVQVRGGSGLFTGRIPFVWYAYAHYISGNRYNNIDYRPTGAAAHRRRPVGTAVGAARHCRNQPHRQRFQAAARLEIHAGVRREAALRFHFHGRGPVLQSRDGHAVSVHKFQGQQGQL